MAGLDCTERSRRDRHAIGDGHAPARDAGVGAVQLTRRKEARLPQDARVAWRRCVRGPVAGGRAQRACEQREPREAEGALAARCSAAARPRGSARTATAAAALGGAGGTGTSRAPPSGRASHAKRLPHAPLDPPTSHSEAPGASAAPPRHVVRCDRQGLRGPPCRQRRASANLPRQARDLHGQLRWFELQRPEPREPPPPW
jgi:hypothetical protein